MTRRDLLAIGTGAAVSTACWPILQRGDQLRILDGPRVFDALPFPDLDRAIDGTVVSAVNSSLAWRSEMSVPDLLHWLRVYGCKYRDEYQQQKAAEVISLLTDDKKIEDRFGQAGVIVKTDLGVRYLSRLSNIDLKEKSRPGHPGQAIAILGEVGLSASASLRCQSHCFTVRDAIMDSVRSLQLRDSCLQEPEWPTEVIAHYVQSSSWKNRWGESINLEDWVDFLLRRDLASYCCGGTHLLQALALMLQSNKQANFLGERVVSRMRSVCAEYAAMLESTQHEDGAWRDDWSKTTEIKGHRAIDVHMTGHILEGQLYLPPELRIRTQSAAAALRSLARAFRSIDHESVWNNYCPYSHAGRVLLICATND